MDILNRICKGKARYMCSEFGVCGFMTRERDLEERDVRDEQWENTPPHTV